MLQYQQRLNTLATQWTENGKRKGDLLTKKRLIAAKCWVEKYPKNCTATIQDFVKTSYEANGGIDTLIITVGTRQIGWQCDDGIVRCFGTDGDRYLSCEWEDPRVPRRDENERDNHEGKSLQGN